MQTCGCPRDRAPKGSSRSRWRASSSSGNVIAGTIDRRGMKPYAPTAVADRCDVPAERIASLAEAFATSAHPLAIGGAATGATNAGATLVAINALNYLAGNLGNQGGVLSNPVPPIPDGHERRGGYQAARELLAAAAGKTVIVRGANPVYSMPPSSGARAALMNTGLFVH